MNDPGTQSWLRTRNDRTAFRLLLEHGALSRSRLAKVSGLSKPTAGQMITRLEQLELIAPVGEVAESRGPNAIAYGVRADARLGVAMSILSDEITAVVVDPINSEYPLAQISTLDWPRSPGADTRAGVQAACASAGIDPSAISEVVIGVQAAVDSGHDEIAYTDTLPGWPQRGAASAITTETGWTVTLENDVNLAVLSERAAGLGAQDFAYLWLGAGLGLGLGLAGEVHRGVRGGAGEIGYLEIPLSAAHLDPGATDFTDLLGGPALIRLLGADPSRGLSQALPGLSSQPQVLAQVAERVSYLAHLLLIMFDPPVVVLGGPTGHAGGSELARLVAEAEPGIAVETSKAYADGGDPVLDGARRLLVRNHHARLEDVINAS